eukprot:TRINITY_DN43278_c0_g1_i1.p1 TRINITY_DN43278_c0_g1~~TRINITY_DN43278_c0_g1_i1.p1  ORF type:complete len:183 (+),score=20.58 TRINITY_DN43278_c0_g1_i1:99-647(+)
MSLLVEPTNKAACDRNEKERKLRMGEFKSKSREDYMMQHIGLPSKPTTASRQFVSSAAASLRRRRQPSEGGRTPLRVASATSLRTGGSASLQMSSSQPQLHGATGSSTRATSPASSMRSGVSYGYGRGGGRATPPMSTVDSEEEDDDNPFKNMRDPVQEYMMKGPPLFSNAICNIAASRGYK